MSTIFNAFAPTFNSVGHDQYNINASSGPSIVKTLENFAIVSAAYNSSERYSEHAATCAENTRDTILTKIHQWAQSNDQSRICWLSGKAGTGKSTIAHTVAEECDEEERLGFSFFFSRRNRDRSDITKFIPTLAYQLSSFLPVIQDPMDRAVSTNPAIFHQSPKVQLAKLVIGPLLSILDSLSTMIIVIDGLDEYSGGVPLPELVALFRDLPDRLPVRILFTSRPEPRIQEIFDLPSMTRKTYHLKLQDFDSRDEVNALLRSRLLTVRDKRGLPSDWPSTNDLDHLSKQSDGLYIYAETLVRFIDDEYGFPPERLQSALKAHTGIDDLYHQVMLEARRYPSFAQVIGSILYLANPLNTNALIELLQLPFHKIRLALRGCFSVLVIPDDKKNYIRPYHASLRDFFVDRSRAKEHFLDPLEYNLSIADNCVKLLDGGSENDAEGTESFHYACQYWCHHLRLAVSCTNGVDRVRSDVKTEMIEAMKNLQSRWLKNWMIDLGNPEKVKTVLEDLCNVARQFEVCQRQRAMSRLMNAYLAKEKSAEFPKLQEVIETVNNFLGTYDKKVRRILHGYEKLNPQYTGLTTSFILINMLQLEPIIIRLEILTLNIKNEILLFDLSGYASIFTVTVFWLVQS